MFDKDNLILSSKSRSERIGDLISAVKNYFALSAENKKYINTRLIDSEKTAQNWINTFNELTRVSENLEGVRSVTYDIVLIGFYVLFSTILFCFLSMPLGFIVLLLTFTMVVVGSIIYYKALKTTLPDSTLQKFLIPLISALEKEINPNETISLKLDLRGFLQRDKVQESTGDSIKLSEERSRKINKYYINDTWCEGKTTLENGRLLYWTITDFVENKILEEYREDSNQSEKLSMCFTNKSKSEIKVKMSVDDNFDLSKETFREEDSKQIQTEEKDGQKWLVISREFKNNTESYELIESHNILDFILLIFTGYKNVSGVQNFNPHGGFGFLKPDYFMDLFTEMYFLDKSQI